MLGKELRSASRRRRTYWVRVAYLAGLSGFVLIAWLAAAPSTDSAMPVAQAQYRLADVGLRLALTIVWFQFYAIQLVALVSTSGQIQSEARTGTLDVLLTTPLTGGQLVVGKLAVSLWQLVTLVAMSLPLLALTRIFGGVPWSLLVYATVITLSAGVLAGAVGLLLSATVRRPRTAMAIAVGLGVGFYVVLVAGAGLPLWPTDLSASAIRGSPATTLLLRYPLLTRMHPGCLLLWCTGEAVAPTGTLPGQELWLGYAAWLALLTAALLCWCTWRVRRLPRARAFGAGAGSGVKLLPLAAARRDPLVRRTGPPRTSPPRARPASLAHEDIREVRGSPVFWKELAVPLLARRALTPVLFLLGLCIVGTIYLAIFLVGT